MDENKLFFNKKKIKLGDGKSKKNSADNTFPLLYQHQKPPDNGKKT